MRYIKTYELFGGLKKFFTRTPKPLPKVYNTSDDIISDDSLSHSDKLLKITELCRTYKIYTITINRDYSVNASYVNMNNLNLDEIPIKFGIVEGSFSAKNNNITTFKNFPKVCRHLDVENNNINTLHGCPESDTLRLKNNNISSLDGLYLGANFIDLANNNISDLTIANDLEYGNTFFSVVENNVTELFPVNSSGVFVTDNPISMVCLYMSPGSDYPSPSWIDSFNSFNIIYNDGKDKTKIFTDNLDSYLSQNKINRAYTLRRLLERLEEYGYELTTMSEYFKQKPETEI